jgi:integrase
LECFGDTPIKDITAKDIFDLLEKLKKEQFSKKTVSAQKNVLNMIFNYAIIHDEISVNPCTAVALPIGLSKKKRQLPTNEELRVVESSEWLFPFFLLYTGCRRGEALAVTYEDIDWEKKVIHINKAVGYKNHIPYIKSTKTEAGERDVILLDKLAKRLPKKKHGLIFPNPQGKVWYESVIDKKWQKWRDDNGITLTAHQLRHGYATILFEAGLEVKDAQYLLGHSSAAITQDIYTHIRQERQERNAEKLNTYLNSL